MVISADKNVVIGQPFTVVVKVTNKTRDRHDYHVSMRGRAMLYTGIAGQVIKSAREKISIQAGQCK